VTTEPELTAHPGALARLNRIRVETAVSRFPIHRLAKKGNIAIDLHRLSETGEADFKWEVTYNIKHGQPGPLAYKIDTLIVNLFGTAPDKPASAWVSTLAVKPGEESSTVSLAPQSGFELFPTG
jgi:hypothetical protein